MIGTFKMAAAVCESGMKSVQKKTKRKKRKKAFYKEIQNQMEFYFSDANLSKDRFMSKLMAETDNGRVSLIEFLKFKKISNLTEDINDIALALSPSEILKVTVDHEVMRKTALQVKEDVDECTIYLEGFPPHVDHSWFHKIFSPFGKIAYLSLPRFKTSNKLKGFAFLEFEITKSATLAFEHFNPELTSCGNADPSTADPAVIKEQPRTNPVAANPDDDLSEEPLRKRPRIEEPQVVDKIQSISQTEESLPGKKRRKRKKKRKELSEIETLHLRVMPKLEWKRLRNVYLTMQRANMTAVKKSLGIIRNPEVSVMTPSGNSLQNAEAEMKPASNVQEFTANVIIKFETSEPVVSAKQFRGEFKDHAGVLYIDLKDGQSIGHIRCDTAENASELLAKMTGKYSQISLLKGDAESEYWTRIAFDRDAKVNGKCKSKSIRGKDKVLSKAVQFSQKVNLHIRFDD